MLVEKAFLINLKIRPDRKESFFSKYPKNDILPEPIAWSAIHGDTCVPPDNWHAGNGAWGCYKTHLNIMEHCINEGIGSYVVFEDDAKFCHDFCRRLEEFADAIPDDWHQFYLGGQLLHEHAHPPIKINDSIYKPYNVNRTHCFGVSRDGLLPLYRHISNLPFYPREHIDHHLGRLHETYNYNIYVPKNWLVGQGGDSSNVSGNTDPVQFFTDPANLALEHSLYRNPVCIVLRGNRNCLEAAKPYIHQGFNLDSLGYDRGLSEAWKYAYPGPEIGKWYSHVRSEIVRAGESKLPCLWHPRITEAMIEQASVGKLVVVDELDETKASKVIKEVVSDYYRS